MTKFTVSLALCLLALAGNALAKPATSKVNLALQQTLKSQSRANIFVSFREGTEGALDSIVHAASATHGDRATTVYQTLTAHSAQSQKNVLALLNSPRFFSFKVQSFWITNQVYVQGADQSVIDALAAMDEVSSIDQEEIVTLDDPTVADFEGPIINAEYGVEIIKAPAAWPITNGAGAVAGIIDTGARPTHEAIRDNYRGGTHSWYNPYTQTQTPGDGHGHGTHCTGTVAGILGIGVAPGAKWISCKGLNDQGSGTQAALLSCGQFMTCPTTYNGGSPNCALAPHVVSNSWGGGAGDAWYNGVMTAWRNAGIIPVFALGNSGSSCRSSNSPGDSTGCIGVGATTATDAIASFSSRGPANAGHQKPDVSAPGNAVRSAGHLSDTAYATMSGTSMACPHVAGLVALLKAKNSNASYDVIKSVLERTTDKNLNFGSQVCNGISEREFPNYTFGHDVLTPRPPSLLCNRTTVISNS